LKKSASVCELFGTMAKPYRSYLPEQDLLLPPSLREWLPEARWSFELLPFCAICRICLHWAVWPRQSKQKDINRSSSKVALAEKAGKILEYNN
jgi:hypothetical protein